MDKKRYERPLIRPILTTVPNKFGAERMLQSQSDVDGVPLVPLAERYGSPLFLFSERKLRQNIRNARRAFSTHYPQVVFAWSYKTNYLDRVCRVFHEEGSWAEVVSSFEYEKAIRNGVAPSHIIFNGPGKSVDDLRRAVQNDSLVHIDNMEEVSLLTSLAKEMNRSPRVAVRVNMETGIKPSWDRFGFNYESGSAMKVLRDIVGEGVLRLVGLHCHIGTFILSAKAYGVAAGKLAELAVSLYKDMGHRIEYIDMGGGFASKNSLKSSYLSCEDICPSMDDYADAICSVFLRSFQPDELPTLVLETGRALVDDAGWLLTSVLSNKRSSSGRLFTTIDAGVNLLFTSFWYNHRVTPVEIYSENTEEVTLCGPLCMNIDVIRERVTLPLMKRGDLLLIHYVGAYNVSQWMQFISLRPKVLMIREDGGVEVIREAEDLDYLSQLER